MNSSRAVPDLGSGLDVATETDAARRLRLGRRAQLLAGTSVMYNVIEAGIAITAGTVAGSVALLSFGLSSVVEVSSGLIILWQFRHPLPEFRERRALRLLAISFIVLGLFVTVQSVRTLVGDEQPAASPVGVGLAMVSLCVMPVLSWAQRRTGKRLGSNAVVADSTQTRLCSYLSAVLLGGLLANALLGWSWADPVAALVIAAIAFREGATAWKGEGCCGGWATAPSEAVGAAPVTRI